MVEYRKLLESEIEAYVEHRLEFINVISHIQDEAAFRQVTRSYLEEFVASNEALIYVAVEEREIVASCLINVSRTAPGPSCLNGKIGELLNVYTKEGYRRKGHAKKLIELAIEEAKSLEVSYILLVATEDGYPLYQSMGFQLLDREMKLSLQ